VGTIIVINAAKIEYINHIVWLANIAICHCRSRCIDDVGVTVGCHNASDPAFSFSISRETLMNLADLHSSAMEDKEA